MVGWLDEDDVSLTYDAAAGVVTRHCGRRSAAVGGDIFAVLERELAAGHPDDHWVGYFGYACRADLPALTGGGLPDAVWMRARHVQFFQHRPGGESRETAGGPQVHSDDCQAADPIDEPELLPSSRAAPAAGYATAFEEVQERLCAGDTYQVNLTYRTELRSAIDPVAAYLRLRQLNQGSYAGFLQHDIPGARAWLLSSSPERFLTTDADRSVEVRPIKGTTPRGETFDEDVAQAALLASRPKYQAENLIIVDLMRNDLSRVCEVGSVEVSALMEVESYATVHQLVSTIRGRLRDGITTVGAIRALFPPGSMTGAPKLRTMEIIRDVESTPRGPYAGALGWICADGSADLGVVIRSVVSGGDGRWSVGTGGGITVMSDASDEFFESVLKVQALQDALDDPLGNQETL